MYIYGVLFMLFQFYLKIQHKTWWKVMILQMNKFGPYICVSSCSLTVIMQFYYQNMQHKDMVYFYYI